MNSLPTLADLLSSQSQDPKYLSSPQTSSYLTYLTSLPLPSLLTEPQTLNDEISTLTSQLTNLCTSEYSTFLSLHLTATTLSDSLSSFSSSLDSLLESIPTLESETQVFASSTQTIQSQRRKATLVLEQHDKLLDILQIPQLIDTCVRNGYYSEAMDLSAHTSTLLAQFPTVPVIIDVAAEAERAIRLMSSQLLVLLREPAKLPALFKAVNFLRRMGTFGEEELALAFLTSRAMYLEGVFSSIDSQRTDPTRYLRRYVDIFREGVYDVVTQYTSILLDRVSQNAELHATLLDFLQTYTHTHISKLVALLNSTVPLIEDPTSLTSLLTQLTYCATSFSRIGLDFQSVLHQPFADAVLTTAAKSLSKASDDFLSQTDKNVQHPPSIWFITPSLLGSLSQQLPPEIDIDAPVHIAPAIISQYPPLASYTNAVIAALNSLRLLAPISLFPEVNKMLEASLSAVGRGLLARAKAIKAEGKDHGEANGVESLVLDAAGSVYLKCLVPFALRALKEGVYGMRTSKGNVESGELAAVKKDWDDWLSPNIDTSDETGATDAVE
ncbi:Dor1-like family-domain-containing protein [Gautieria morchelliformis]|nr:Dor1-like family-domain-containing protein [Gautieria morchelliformis]